MVFIPLLGWSQPLNIKNSQGGIFSLGLRTTVSAFSGENHSDLGSGIGGQFRLQFADRINTEWFLDYLTGIVGDFASRTDYHIGWSVMYYLTKRPDPIVKPYFVAGHCFDRTVLTENSDRSHSMSKNSSAVQAGVGVHFNLTERFDISLNTQYMMHIGEDLHAHSHDGEVHFERTRAHGLEGHFLMHVGLNYKIADLW